MALYEIRQMSAEGRQEFSLLSKLLGYFQTLVHQDSGELVLHNRCPRAYGAEETYVWRNQGSTIILKAMASKHRDYAEDISLTFSPRILRGSAIHSQIFEIGISGEINLFKESS